MERSDFLKKGFGFMGVALIAPSLFSKSDEGSASCVVANTETAGPFPTINPANLNISNIVGSRTGVPFTINITVRNVNDACNPVQGLLVDIWHCDKDGYYSQYGGTSMQQVDYTNETFLRGRQTSDANGLVSFTSIFPGWYQSRATHIHVHIYTASGTSLAITQIAFPEDANSAVVTVNAATAYGYTKGMNGYTYNASDNVFSDGTTTEMSTITGSLSAGYVLSWDAYVNAPVTVTGINEQSAESQFQVRQNFPNPCGDQTKVPVVLKTPSRVRIAISDLQGVELKAQVLENLSSGEQLVDVDMSGLPSGRYVYEVKVTNLSGTFRQSKLLIKN